MFDADPFSADWIDRPPRIVLTMVGGKIVYADTEARRSR
jgi:hypothetical protein